MGNGNYLKDKEFQFSKTKRLLAMDSGMVAQQYELILMNFNHFSVVKIVNFICIFKNSGENPVYFLTKI